MATTGRRKGQSLRTLFGSIRSRNTHLGYLNPDVWHGSACLLGMGGLVGEFQSGTITPANDGVGRED
jgi:hypothetical protein